VTTREEPTAPNRVGQQELGTTNPRRVGATLYEDFIPQLRGRKAAAIYQEMAWNDATIGAILYAVEQLVRQVVWSVDSDSEQTTEFLADNIQGLQSSWDDFISSALTEVIYGWSMFEVVYKLESGRLYWDKFGFRAQESLHEWILSDKGDLEAFVQIGRTGENITIPADKLIHFRTTTGDGRPEGRSWLRRCYRAWHMKKYVEDQTAIGISRDLNGVPLAKIPSETLMAGPGNDEYDTVKEIITGLKVDEQAGVMWPSDVEEDGHELFSLELLSTSGRPKTDSLAFIRQAAMDISAVMLAQFIGLGRDAVGSRALAEPQQELFQTALGALLDSIEEQFHRQATEKLLEMNGLPSGRIKHGELRDIDLDAIGNYVLRVSQAGGEFFGPDGAGMDEFREMAGLQPLEMMLLEDENTEQDVEPDPEVEDEGPDPEVGPEVQEDEE
jgi:hypothetical protein